MKTKNESVFSPAEILLPKSGTDMTAWSVIACDQFSSDPAYWNRVAANADGKPSTLDMIIPEAFLSADSSDAAQACNAKMNEYLTSDLFTLYSDSFIYVERIMSDGNLRRGLVGKLDLNAYEYVQGTDAAVRASEKTVIERIPPRVAVRSGASLELPHAMILMDDFDRTVIEPLTEIKASLPVVYDFDLNEGGGHITGYLVKDEIADRVLDALSAFSSRDVQMVIGDGNHSLAAAKACWEQLKPTLSEEEQTTNVARWALAELSNVYDDGIAFEPIHRVMFHVDPDSLLEFLRNELGSGDGTDVRCVWNGGETTLHIPSGTFGGMIAALQNALDKFLASSASEIDYIHDDSAALALASQAGNMAIFLPAMDKADLFKTVIAEGVFPRKSFSIGHARDKRYYLEARKIKN